MNSFWKKYGWHVVGIIAFLIIPLLLYPKPPEQHHMAITIPSIRDFVSNLLMLVIFYLNYYYFIPQFYFEKKYITYASFVIISFAIICFVPSWFTGLLPHLPETIQNPPSRPFPGPPQPRGNFFMVMSHQIFLFISVILFSVLLKTSRRLLQTEATQHSAQLGSLKAQINPHFLFNTLNNIYALAVKDQADSTAQSLLKLSGMMRYVVTETADTFVPLQKEIDYINDYIELQKIRINDTVNLIYTVGGNLLQKRIAPLTLIPFIENAFKHGVNPDVPSTIQIQIKVLEQELSLTVVNDKVRTMLHDYEESHQGIENTKKRLSLLYPGQYSLAINESTDVYKTHLQLKLI